MAVYFTTAGSFCLSLLGIFLSLKDYRAPWLCDTISWQGRHFFTLRHSSTRVLSQTVAPPLRDQRTIRTAEPTLDILCAVSPRLPRSL